MSYNNEYIWERGKVKWLNTSRAEELMEVLKE